MPSRSRPATPSSRDDSGPVARRAGTPRRGGGRLPRGAAPRARRRCRAQVHLAHALRRQRRWTDAAQAYRAAIRAPAPTTPCWAISASRSGTRAATARPHAAFREALRLEPQNPAWHGRRRPRARAPGPPFRGRGRVPRGDSTRGPRMSARSAGSAGVLRREAKWPEEAETLSRGHRRSGPTIPTCTTTSASRCPPRGSTSEAEGAFRAAAAPRARDRRLPRRAGHRARPSGQARGGGAGAARGGPPGPARRRRAGQSRRRPRPAGALRAVRRRRTATRCPPAGARGAPARARRGALPPGEVRARRGRLSRGGAAQARLFAKTHAYLGEMLSEQGRLVEAAEAFRAAVAPSPTAPPRIAASGACCSPQGRHAEAEAAYREVLRLRPEEGQNHFNLWTVLERQGKDAESEAAYREAIRAQARLRRGARAAGLGAAAPGPSRGGGRRLRGGGAPASRRSPLPQRSRRRPPPPLLLTPHPALSPKGERVKRLPSPLRGEGWVRGLGPRRRQEGRLVERLGGEALEAHGVVHVAEQLMQRGLAGIGGDGGQELAARLEMAAFP